MPIYNRTKFTPARGGHAPGHLREAFLEAIEIAYSEDDADPVVPVGWNEVPMPLSRLCGLLWNCSDILPSGECGILDLRAGSTYAMAARKLRVPA